MSGKRVPFVSRPGSTVNIDVAATSKQVRITIEKGDTDIRVCNLGTAPVWFRFGPEDGTANVNTDMPIPAGGIEVHGVPPQATSLWVQAIAAGATGKIYFTPGEGI